MPERQGNTRASGRRESRRRFFQLLAGSPLLAAAYPALRPAWQEGGGRVGIVPERDGGTKTSRGSLS